MMFTRKPIDAGNGMVDRASQAAGDSIASAQAAATTLVDNLADGAQSLQHRAGDAVGQAAHKVDNLARQGAEALHSSTQHLLDRAHAASRQTQHYIEREPVKAVLIAAATGAALMALASLLSRNSRRD